MRLDEGIQPERLTLEVTPLIDVVFILVLFFAVSTSFISSEDLDELKTSLVSLVVDKQQLTGRVQGQREELTRLDRDLGDLESAYARMVAEKTAELQAMADEIERSEGKRAKLEWMISALEDQQGSLRKRLSASTGRNADLEAQLEQAYRDYEALDVELTGLRSERDRQAEDERLLKALLLERAERNQALAAELGSTSRAAAELRTVVTGLKKDQIRQAESASLLRALIAERAAEVAALEGRLGGEQAASARQAAEAERLRLRLRRLQGELSKYRAVAKLDREQIEELMEAQAKLRAGLARYLEQNELDIKQDKRRLTLQLSSQVLFDSGSASINARGLGILRKVGGIIKSRIGQLELQVSGHTDDVPIRAGHGGAMATNWDLSAARAVNVVRFFEEEVGIDPERMSAVGYSRFRPVASNATPEGRARNRRIEIVLVPR